VVLKTRKEEIFMETLRWKARIAVLWIVAAVAMSAHMILMSLDPTAMKKVAEWAVAARDGEGVFLALFWLVPLWLAFLAVTMKDSVNRWVNFVVAAIFTIIGIWHFFICGVPLLKGGPFVEPIPHHILLVGSTVLATTLIAWYAWKWPKREALGEQDLLIAGASPAERRRS
jgi:hypothetical protein